LSEPGKRIAVVGVGNILMGDDGVGVRAVEELRRENLPAQVTLFDAGTAFPTFFYQLVHFDKLIVIDAVKGGGAAGTVYRFGLEEVQGNDRVLLSLHDLGIVETLLLQRLIDESAEEIVFFGLEPARVQPSLKLSLTVKAKLRQLVDMVLQELEKDGARRVKYRDGRDDGGSCKHWCAV